MMYVIGTSFISALACIAIGGVTAWIFNAYMSPSMTIALLQLLFFCG